MEKNTQHDPLDEYIRHSFDDYAENPAADMWSRIEGDLATGAPAAPAIPVWRAFYVRNRLRLATVFILLLLSGLVCEHFYYENKMQALLEKTAREQPATEKGPEPGEQGIDPKTLHENGGQPDGGFTGHIPFAAPAPLPGGVTVFTQKGNFTSPPVNPSPKWEGRRDNHRRISDLTLLKGIPSHGEGPGVGLIHTESAGQFLTAPVTPETGVTGIFPKGLVACSVLAPRLIALPLPARLVPSPTTVVPRPIEPVRPPSGWYIGFSGMPYRAIEKTAAPARRPGLRPVFVSESERPEVAVDWWFRVGKKTNRRFGWESGIGYAENTRTTAHTARFRFADGVIHPGGPIAGQRRNFSYDLSAYGGSAAVSLRMEPADDSTPVADTEPVVVKITTTERSQLLRIPVLLTCRMGAGRLQAVAKAGLTGNVFLKNDLSMTTRASQNSRLRFAQSVDSFLFEPSGDFYLGYWASAGLEFRWSRHLRLVAEPAVSGNFSRHDAQGRRLPDQVLAGVNVGLHWAF